MHVRTAALFRHNKLTLWAVALTCVLSFASSFGSSAQPLPTARLSGRITSTNSEPLRDTGLSLVSAATGVLVKETSSDQSGLFSMEGIAAGKYLLTATRPGFLTTQFGAGIGGSNGRPIVVGALGARLDNLDITLVRAGALSGSLLSRDGSPAADVSIVLLRLSLDESRFAHIPAAKTITNRHGSYRFYELRPGRYGVAAVPKSAAGGSVDGEAIDHVALRATSELTNLRGSLSLLTYYPGSPTSRQASIVTVAAERETTGVDFVLQQGSEYVVEGRLLSLPQPIIRDETPAVRLEGYWQEPINFSRPIKVDSEGRFRVSGVPPGWHRVVAESGTGAYRSASGPASSAWWTAAEAELTNQDLPQVYLAVTPVRAATIRLKFVQSGSRLQNQSVQVTFRSVTAQMTPRLIAVTVQANQHGDTLVTNLLPGRYWIDAVPVSGGSGAPTEWYLHNIIANRSDVTAREAQLLGGDDIEIALTDKPNRILGRLAEAHSDRFPRTVVLLPADLGLARPGSPRLGLAAVDTGGSYTFQGMPAGDYTLTLIAAASSTDLDDWEFLRRVSSQARARFTLHEGEVLMRDIDVSRQ